MLYKVVLTFESVDDSNESYSAILSWGAVHYAAQGGSHLSLWKKSKSVTIQVKATKQYFSVVLFFMLHKVV